MWPVGNEFLSLRPSRDWKGEEMMESAAENAGSTHWVRRKHEGAPGVAHPLPCTPIPQSLIRDPTPSRLGSKASGRVGLPLSARPRGTPLTFFTHLGRPRQPPPTAPHMHTLNSGHRGGFALPEQALHLGTSLPPSQLLPKPITTFFLKDSFNIPLP